MKAIGFPNYLTAVHVRIFFFAIIIRMGMINTGTTTQTHALLFFEKSYGTLHYATWALRALCSTRRGSHVAILHSFERKPKKLLATWRKKKEEKEVVVGGDQFAAINRSTGTLGNETAVKAGACGWNR
jgi:hypothetical protein